MARQEENREDILREATALVERVELRIPSYDESIVAGFRRDGSASFYFGADPVFQFNARGELRRAYRDGQLIKAVRGKLVVMRREREANATILRSHDMSASETQAFLDQMMQFVERIRQSFQLGAVQIMQQIPADGQVTARLKDWLNEFPASSQIADRPNV